MAKIGTIQNVDLRYMKKFQISFHFYAVVTLRLQKFRVLILTNGILTSYNLIQLWQTTDYSLVCPLNIDLKMLLIELKPSLFNLYLAVYTQEQCSTF